LNRVALLFIFSKLVSLILTDLYSGYGVQKMFSILKKVIEAVAKEQRVSKEGAIRLIRDRKDLLQRAAKEVGDSEMGTLRMLLPKFVFE
jgi:hypothetical protein